jgi:hypothetical protein
MAVVVVANTAVAETLRRTVPGRETVSEGTAGSSESD